MCHRHPLRSSRACRRGFTLIELLVVIAIIAVLIGMLLPAVQKVREAAARSQCSNKLRQIAIALHNYHNAYSRFPPGAVVDSSNLGHAPWTVPLLPFLEDSGLYAQFNMSPTATWFAIYQGNNETNKAAQLQRNTKFECPSDPNSNATNSNCNYFGVQGGGQAQYTSCTPPICSAGTNFPGRVLYTNGVLYNNSTVRLTDIKDGTTNTFMVGESRYLSLQGALSSFWGTWASTFYNAGEVAGPVEDGAMPIVVAAARDPINSSAINPSVQYTFEVQSRMFGSWHTGGGCHFARCDASVVFISNSIDLATYQNMGSIRDGLPIGGDL